MSLSTRQLVDIPEHTVYSKKDGVKYVYLITKSFRNAKGQPDNKRISIGKLDEESGKLIPNMNYYELFQKEPPMNLPNIVRKCGTYAVCRKMADNLGLTKTLKKAFPDEYKEVLTGAHYMLTSGSVMYYLDDWLDETISFNPDAMSDVSIGRIFKEITEENKNIFFREWFKNKANKEFIAYDVTSISSYAKGLDNVEFGYNRDKEKLPQINYGMYFGEKSRLPFYYKVYPGSIVDKTYCEYMIDGTDWLDFKKAYFVMDKGFFTEDNLKLITRNGHRFMITVPPSLKLYKQLVDKNKDDIINNIDCKMKDRLVYCKKVEDNSYGFRMNAHIFYNQEKALDNAGAFYTKLETMMADISKMKELPPKGSSYYDYFTLTEKDGYILAAKKNDAIKAALARCGFFIIAETAFNKTSEEVLQIYANRDSIEKCFDDLKNEIDLNRIRCSKDETANGKFFVAFISLILLSQLRKNLAQYKIKDKTTLKKILNELDKIKIVYDSSKPDNYRMLNPLTRKQKDILNSLDMNEDIFKNLV